MYKTLIGALVLAASLSITPNNAQAEEKVEKYSHHGFWAQRPKVTAVAPEDFVIMPWGWSAGDESVLKDIKDCGFNLAGIMTPEYVNVAKKVGLKCIVDDYRISNVIDWVDISDAEIEKRVNSVVRPLKGNSAVFGYYLKDEPGSGLYPTLARWKSAFSKADPKAISYINLLPIGAQDGGVRDYDEYVDKYITTVKPTYISYDHYTLYDDGSMNDSFYRNLEVIRKASVKHDIPFWNIIQSVSFANWSDPTPAGLSVQAYSTLAYGGKGICYFTYFTPLIGNFRNSAIDQFMNKTPTWDMVRRVNLQMHQLLPTYLKLKHINVFHHPNVPAGCSGIDTSRHIESIAGGNFLLGEYMGPNSTPYVMIVNKDIHKSCGFSVKFKKQGQAMMTNSSTGLTVPLGGENFFLGPGQGVLLSLAKSEK